MQIEDNPAGNCTTLGWMNAYRSGVMQVPAGNKPENRCVLPNAAIAWKQPNGFYYPPAFHSDNIAFQNVDIRHFVIQPLWEPGTFKPDIPAIKNTYCAWEPADFINFTDVDRQTELSDDNGSITGLVSGAPPDIEPSISVTRDPFFNAPLVTAECASSIPDNEATVDTSPYQYVTTAIFPKCAGAGGSCTAEWSTACTNQSCAGVPLYRQYLTDDEFKKYEKNSKDRPSIRMMGQSTGQRSTLTINHGSYYIDTTEQEEHKPDKNRFLAGQPYYVYLLYATPATHQTYSLYIGHVPTEKAEASVVAGQVDITSQAYTFKQATPGNWITKTYNPDTGVLSVTIDLKNEANTFENDRGKFCQPQTYCSIHSDGSCGCAPGSDCKEDSVCAWSNKEVDCPIAGCFGFSITLPKEFSPLHQANLPPAPIHFVGDPGSDPYFNAGNVQFYNVNQSVSGAQCFYPMPPKQTDKGLRISDQTTWRCSTSAGYQSNHTLREPRAFITITLESLQAL